MSADYWLEGAGADHYDTNVNATYNLGKMLRAAGFPDWEALRGAPASEAAGMLNKVAGTLRADPETFRRYNPPNGWGNYELAVEFVETFRDHCSAFPAATIGAWL
jgi:hypothetical protein